MSLSNHFKRTPSFEYADLSWLSPVPIAVEGEVKIKVSKTQPTEPTELPPSKGVLTYVKNARFNAYKSTRPALLTEINSLVDSGLQRIEREFGENIPEHLVLDVYSKGFERYINESSLYQPFLRRTKDEYDKTVLRQLNKLATYVDFDKQLQQKDAQHSNQLSETVNELQLQIKELEEKYKVLQSNEIVLKTTIKNYASENTRLQDANALLKSEVEASKGTCNSLSTSLARLVDDKNKSDILESTMMVNLSHCKQVENSLNMEIDKLHQIIADKDAVFETLVTPERLAGVSAQLALTGQENKRISSTHRQLLLRYSSLKFMIDAAFRKLDDAKQHSIGIPRVERMKTQSAVQLVMNEYNESKALQLRKERLKLKSPTEKILELIEDTSYPKVIFECLLDQIEVLQVEKRRLLYGDDADAGIGEDGAVNEDGEIAEVIPAGELIECLGLGEEVPCYLRMEGTVRNLHIDRRTTVELVHEICAAKVAHEMQNAHIVRAVPALTSPSDVGAEHDDNKNHDSDYESADPGSPTSRAQADLSRMNITSGAISPLLLSPTVQLQSASHNDSVDAEYVPLLPSLHGQSSMAEFFECFLKDKTREAQAAVELAYNVVEALQLYADNSDCRLFSAMLAGTERVFIWADQTSLIEKLRSAVIKENATNTRSADGEWKLTPDKFFKVVRKMLSTKTEDEFTLLKDAMTEQQLQNPESRYVNATLLLYDGDEGERPRFLELVKTQHLEDCQSMRRAVLDSIEAAANEESGFSSDIAIHKLREAIAAADANKTRTEVNQLLARGAACSVEAVLLREAKRIPLQVAEFKTNICEGVLKKSPPPVPKKAKK